MSAFFSIVFEIMVRLIIVGATGFGAYKLYKRQKSHKIWAGLLVFVSAAIFISVFTPSSYTRDNMITAQDDSDSSDKITIDSNDVKKDSDSKVKKTNNHPTTLSATTKYLNKKIGDTTINKASMTDGILNVEYNGRDFNGKFMGSGTMSNMADDLKTIQGLPLAKKGVTLLQVDTYENSKGNKEELLSYAIYYSRKNLDSINFEDYTKIVGHTPKLLFTNASEYYMNDVMKKGKENQVKDIDSAKVGNKAVIADYMDKYHAV